MAATKEKVKLDETSYQNVLNMLNSTDPESVNVGLAIIENCDMNNSLMFIMMLKKLNKASGEIWKKEAPKSYAFLKRVGAEPDKVMTFKSMCDVAVAKKEPKSHMDFYIKVFSDHIKENVSSIGYDFIEGIEVTLTLKDDK